VVCKQKASLLTSYQAAPILEFGPEAEEMIGHAICALETISTWSETSSAASPAQHLAWSNEMITKMRDNNIVDVSVLVGKQDKPAKLHELVAHAFRLRTSPTVSRPHGSLCHRRFAHMLHHWHGVGIRPSYQAIFPSTLGLGRCPTQCASATC
jgi:hypothetical protein